MHERDLSRYNNRISDVFVINNPASGTRDRSPEVGMVKDYLEKRVDGKFHFCETEGPGHAKLLVLKAVTQGYKHIVVMGGDGLLRETGAAVAGSNADITLLPKGSEEMARRDFKMPRSLMRAAEVLFDGRVQLIDTGTVNGERFIINMGIGADAEVVNGVQKPGLKKDGHGVTTYLKQAVKILPTTRGVAAKLTIDGEICFTDKLYQFWVNNGRRLARFPITKGDIDDGKYEVLLAFAERLSQLVFPGVIALATGKNSNRFTRMTASNIDVDLSRARKAQVDGDPLASSDHFEVRMHPRSLRIRVPDGENVIYGRPPMLR